MLHPGYVLWPGRELLSNFMAESRKPLQIGRILAFLELAPSLFVRHENFTLLIVETC